MSNKTEFSSGPATTSGGDSVSPDGKAPPIQGCQHAFLHVGGLTNQQAGHGVLDLQLPSDLVPLNISSPFCSARWPLEDSINLQRVDVGKFAT